MAEAEADSEGSFRIQASRFRQGKILRSETDQVNRRSTIRRTRSVSTEGLREVVLGFSQRLTAHSLATHQRLLRNSRTTPWRLRWRFENVVRHARIPTSDSVQDELVRPVRSLRREVIRASVDGFHNPREIRYQKGSASPEGFFLNSYNYDALRDLLIDPLGPGGSLNYRTTAFDWRTDSPSFSPQKQASENAILLFDESSFYDRN
jgi:hypothetical protein